MSDEGTGIMKRRSSLTNRCRQSTITPMAYGQWTAVLRQLHVLDELLIHNLQCEAPTRRERTVTSR